MQDKEKTEQIRKITQEILVRVRASFETHKRKVDQMNSEKSSSAMKKDDVMHSFYEPIPNLIQELKKLQTNLRKCEKLRKQRKQLYEKNTVSFLENLELIRKNKHMIKIQINEHLLRVVQESAGIIQQAQLNIKNFQKEANLFCGGKAHDYKPAVEKAMAEVGQYGFLWANMGKLNSVKNDSVQQIYLPVKYQSSQFDNIQNQIKNLWPSPKVQVIKEEIKVPQIHVKDDSHLREAHEMFFGFTRPQNIPKAIEMYKSQAQKSNCHPTALNALGQIYEKGKFVSKDLIKAVMFYKKSADKEDPEGMYKIGQYLQKGLINSKEYFSGLYPNKEAEIRGGIEYYEKAAKKGHLDAMTDLGFIYEKGIKNENGYGYFIQPHPQHALKYYLKARKSQFPRSYNNLGTLHITCPNLPEEIESGNLLKGVKYLEKAVALKYPRAYFNLGKCYENGVGVVENLDKARSLYLQGAQGGDTQCKLQYIKSYLGYKISDQKTLLKMVQLTRKVLVEEERNAEALFYMGLFFEKGIGVQINKQSSFYYIETAARLDYSPAITKLGDFYYSGFYVHKDLDYAKSLYEKAANKMETKALVNLGVMAEKGIGMEENNMNKAQQYYEQAASLGNPNALLLLNMGDKKQSQQALVKAAELGSMQAARILKDMNKKSMMGKRDVKAKTYGQTLKNMQSMYVKKSGIGHGNLASHV